MNIRRLASSGESLGSSKPSKQASSFEPIDGVVNADVECCTDIGDDDDEDDIGVRTGNGVVDDAGDAKVNANIGGGGGGGV